MTFRSAKTMDTQSNRLNACVLLQTTKTVNPLTCIFKRYSIIALRFQRIRSRHRR